jgi:hypothetical protein
MITIVLNALNNAAKNYPSLDLDDIRIEEGSSMRKVPDTIISMYKSVRFDLQRILDIKQEDYDRLFPNMEPNIDSFGSVQTDFSCLGMQLKDMEKYCSRLL